MSVEPGMYRYWIATRVFVDDNDGGRWEWPTGTVGGVDVYPPRNPGDRYCFVALDPAASAPTGANDYPIAHIDSGFPVTPNGSDITITWDPAGIIALT